MVKSVKVSLVAAAVMAAAAGAVHAQRRAGIRMEGSWLM